jgi:Flp pilus assembly protein TadG
MKTTIRNGKSERRRGAAMVELALIFMACLLFVVALVELGRGVWAYNTLAHATRQGARYAMARGTQNPATEEGVTTTVRNAAVGLDPDDITVTTTWDSGVERNGTVRVHSEYNFRPVTGTLIVSQRALLFRSTSTVLVAN